eukprot:m.188963 g.188963  ORF g.188963 m.188963 type:complete len:277 (+) comp17594_c0_seq1:55-885(+)
MVHIAGTDLGAEYARWLAMRDPRVQHWFLVESPVPTLCLSLGYLVIVWLGQRIMRSREAFVLQSGMKLYNAVTVLLNAYILYLLVSSAVMQYRAGTLNALCAAVDYTDNPASMRMALGIYLFYLSKAFEFVDTFLMVLRKKTRQISFLHLYHHSTMFPIWWIGVNWVPGGNSAFSATINSGVHVIMYTYYFLAASGVDRRWLWWKRWLTQLQMTQFLVIFIQAAYAIREVDAGRCQFPVWMGYANMLYMVSMVTLFGLFYVNAYMQPKRASKTKET